MKNLTAFTLPMRHLAMIETGWGNGYVAVPKEHPCFEKEYDNIDVEVHGGLTFSASSLNGQPKETEGMWIIGFDCAHSRDSLSTCPKEYVEKEAESLKEQLLNIKA